MTGGSNEDTMLRRKARAMSRGCIYCPEGQGENYVRPKPHGAHKPKGSK